jgi:hypothetical protein
MEKEFVPYELALKIKQLGFDEPCFAYYDVIKVELDTISSEVCERLCKHNTHIKAPTFSQVFRWFREKYNMKPCFDWHPTEKYRYCIYYSVNTYFQICDFETYEEAELACLEKLIEIVSLQNIK